MFPYYIEEEPPFRPLFPAEHGLVWEYKQLLRNPRCTPLDRAELLEDLARKADQDEQLRRYLRDIGWDVSAPGQPARLDVSADPSMR